MDLVDTLRKKIDVLKEGDYIPGLEAVLMHIETAFRHLSRGQETDDDTAFTDAIYRINQAFEGSIKEAYRVLANQDPDQKRPFDIEAYLEKNNVFRSRILSQLTTYRTEWRNPSAHDYKLDFDESEAFLAIVSVSAFACLLLDQIAERLAFNQSQIETEAQKPGLVESLASTTNAALLVRVTDLVTQFCSMHFPSSTASARKTEFQLIGALNGFLSSVDPHLQISTEAKLGSEKILRPDLLIARGEEHVMIELKRRFTQQGYASAIAQVESYVRIGGLKSIVLLFLPESPSDMDKAEIAIDSGEAKLVVLKPIKTNTSVKLTIDDKH